MIADIVGAPNHARAMAIRRTDTTPAPGADARSRARVIHTRRETERTIAMGGHAMSEGPYMVRNVSTLSETKYSLDGPTDAGYLSEHPELLQDMADALNAAHKAGVEEGKRWTIDRLLEILVERGVMPKAVADQIGEMRDWVK